MQHLSRHALAIGSRLVVVAILGFIILPAVVVGIAAFNDQALLAFPPKTLSLRWFIKAIEYRDFPTGFCNGADRDPVVVDDRARRRSCLRVRARPLRVPTQAAMEALLLAPLVVPHFTVGLGFLILAAQLGATRGYAVVIACHVVLVLPFVLRSVYISLRNLDGGWSSRRRASARARPACCHRHAAAAAARSGERLAVRGDPLLQRVHRLAVRHRPAHADAAGRHVQLRARIRRSHDGGLCA